MGYKNQPISDSHFMDQGNVDKVVNYLSMQFNEAVNSLKKKESGNIDTLIKKNQEDFAWILHDIATGPVFFAQNNINKAQAKIKELDSIK